MGEIAEEIFVQLVAGLGSNPTQSQLEAAATQSPRGRGSLSISPIPQK